MNTASKETDLLKLAIRSQEIMSPWFTAHEYRPIAVGPYQCNTDGSPAMHMRWWNGVKWSFPLQSEHETLDGEYIEPDANYFMPDDSEYRDFAWRGFNEDQEPL